MLLFVAGGASNKTCSQQPLAQSAECKALNVVVVGFCSFPKLHRKWWTALRKCVHWSLSTKVQVQQSTCGLVAMTSASHAEGRQFDPG